jgi:hypothetical protein
MQNKSIFAKAKKKLLLNLYFIFQGTIALIFIFFRVNYVSFGFILNKAMKIIFSLLLLVYAFSNAQLTTKEEIDQKRQGLWYFDKKAFDLYREFLRIDSNYYVGWLYEGAAKYYRSQDVVGYASAIKPLLKAKEKFYKTEKSKLRVRTQDVREYIPVFQAHQDYCMIMYLLYQCYMNIEEQKKAFDILIELKNQKLQKYFFIEPYNSMSWIMHRVRTLTSKQFPYSAGDIEKNEIKALKYIDSSMYHIRKYYNWNTSIFSPNYVNQDFYSNYHNKALIYNYIYELDSSEFYHKLMEETPFFSNNNYAYLFITKADFRNAEKNFLIEKKLDTKHDKRTKEYNYMLSILDTYKAMPKANLEEVKENTKNIASLPGFGWNNIALARLYYYLGYYHEAHKHMDKAKNFQELHINTSWSPEQYDYAISLYQYLVAKRKIEQVFFLNQKWWLNPNIILSLPKLYLDMWSYRYQLIGRFGSNPERHHAFYRIFNSESVLSFDEIWLTIEGFNTQYFLNLFSQNLSNDKRPTIHRYYHYFLGNLCLQKDDESGAEFHYNKALNDPFLDLDYDKLLLARCYEGLYKIYQKKDEKDKIHELTQNFYKLFPGLVPYSNFEKRALLKINTQDEFLKRVYEQLKSTSVEWQFSNNENFIIPEIEISYVDSAGIKLLFYRVELPNGENLEGSMVGEDLKEVSQKLALCAFGIATDEVPMFEDYDYKNLVWIGLPALFLWLIYRIRRRYT